MSGNSQNAAVDEPYWRALSQGRIAMQCCKKCGHWHWPAVWRCGECGGWDPSWEELPLEGVAYSWATTWHKFAGTEHIGVPYTTILAALPKAQGRRLLGLFEGNADDLELDAPLVARIGETQIGETRIPALFWRLA